MTDRSYVKKNDSLSKILIAGLLCLAFAFSIWRWTENKISFYLSQSDNNLIQIAQIKSKTNSVLRNHSGQLVWQDVENGDSIFIGNSIQTEKKSSTEIIMNDGEKIIIGPESLVRFTNTEDKISLQLIDGKMEVKSPDPATRQTMRLDTQKTSRLWVQTPRGRVHLKDSNLKMQTQKNKDQDFKIEVVSGTPELVTTTKTEALKSSKPNEKITVVDIDDESPVKPLETEIAPTVTPTTIPEVVTTTITPPAEIASPSVAPAPAEATSSQPTTTSATEKIVPVKIKTDSTKLERQPAQIQLKAPKIKSIKVKDVQ